MSLASTPAASRSLRFAFAALLLCALASSAFAAETPARALLVLEKEQNTLVILDPATLTIVARVPVGQDPHEVAVSADGRIAYVTNYHTRAANGSQSDGSTIAVVDLVAQKALAPIQLGALTAPHGLEFSHGKLYFTAEGAKVVGSYDPATAKIDWVLGTGQDRTHMVAVSRDGKVIFTSNVSSGTISIIEQVPVHMGPPPGLGGPGTPPQAPPPGMADRKDWAVTNIPVGRGAEGFDVTPDGPQGQELWVANAGDHTVSVVDVATKRVVATLPSTQFANRLKITVDGRYAFVSDMATRELLAIDVATRKEFRRIQLPGNSEGLLMSPDGARLYVTLNQRDSVAVIDLHTMTVTGEVKTGRGPDGLAWAERN